ncbi:FAD binding domain protein [Aspergillus avenaceus]|uniref:FAD binding domain protein n=1 Tax=Aspergillus avenaceus TaxID=36643 RepID=A0A5N6U154_ASPAV|nr:FAD binding domain protein [Aspergillus avenaceus]
MRNWLVFLLACYTARGSEQAIPEPFEPSDFDIAEALSAHNVDISRIRLWDDSFEFASSVDSQDLACQRACTLLSTIYDSSSVLIPSNPLFQNTTSSFWSAQQAEAEPSCIFTPRKDADVSILVLFSRLTSCPFAVTSGGHAAFTGASNIDGGITVLLKELNDISLNDDKSIVSVGAGTKWVSLYAALEPHGLAAVGARDSDLGVGGFLTGGGISFYSNLYGWGCDNIESFEVVTAKGTTITASATSNPDLYWALRGGGNNFGIVTKFNLYTIPSPTMRGGTRTIAQSNFTNVVNAFINVADQAPVDGKAQQWVAFLQYEGHNLASVELAYTEDVENPAIFEEYRSIPAVSDTTKPKTMQQYSKDVTVSSPPGLRQVYSHITLQLNKELADWVVEYFFSVRSQVSHVEGVMPVLVYHGLTIPMLKNMSRNGGNAIGLDASKGPLMIMQIPCWWMKASDDEVIYEFLDKFWEVVIDKAKSMGVYHRFTYMNYASMFQDPIASYGAENKARLLEIAAKYDPMGVFQTLQPGYFKLNGAPVWRRS